MKRRNWWLSIIVVLFFALSACGNKTDPINTEYASKPDDEAAPGDIELYAELTDITSAPQNYQAQLHQVSLDLSGICQLMVDGDTAWLIGLRYYPLSEDGIPTLVTANWADATVDYTSLNIPVSADLLAADAQDSVFYVLYSYFDETGQLALALGSFDRTGQHLDTWPLTDLLAQFEQLTAATGIVVTGNGSVLISTPADLLLLSANGELTGSLSCDKYVTTVLTDMSGTPLCLLENEQEDDADDPSGIIAAVDTEAMRLTALCQTEPLRHGSNGYVWNETALYAVTGGNLTPLCNWSDAGVTAPWYLSVQDGRIWMLRADYNNLLQLLSLEPADTVEAEDAQTLTVAVVEQPAGRGLDVLLRDFSLQNPQYTVEVWDYTVYDNPIQQFYADVLSGNTPDLYCLTGLPLPNMVSNGLLLDCYPLLSQSEVIDQEDFVPGFLSAMEYADGLYRISPTVQVVTLVGSETLFGNATTISLSALNEAWLRLQAENPDAVRGTGSAEMLLPYLLYGSLEKDFINWETGECNFTGTEFLELLEFVKENQEPYDAVSTDTRLQMVQSGDAMVLLFGFSNFEQFVKVGNILTDGYALVGFPPSGAVCGLTCPLGISSATQNQSGAWALMEFLLSYEYQSHVTNPFPVRQDALEYVFHSMNSPVTYYDANGQKMDLVRTLEINRSATVVNPLTQADFDKILNCFNRITAAYYSDDETLVSIIYEEAIPYINGLKSVEQVADIIQNRVQTYVDERID